MGPPPAFKGLSRLPGQHLAPASTNQVVHGIPSSKQVIPRSEPAQIDTAPTNVGGITAQLRFPVCVGESSEGGAPAESGWAPESLMKGPGPGPRPATTLPLDIAGAVQDHVEAPRLCRRGGLQPAIGVEPQPARRAFVFNFRPTTCPTSSCVAGMTLAVGADSQRRQQRSARTLADAGTVVTADGSLSAQWEAHIVVTSDGCEILTDRRTSKPTGHSGSSRGAGPSPSGIKPAW